jgi:hypothetical protein
LFVGKVPRHQVSRSAASFECGADGNAIGMQEWLFTEETTH